MMAAMSLGAMPISLRGAGWPDSVRDFEQLTPDNCGSASNGGRKNSVAKPQALRMSCNATLCSMAVKHRASNSRVVSRRDAARS